MKTINFFKLLIISIIICSCDTAGMLRTPIDKNKIASNVKISFPKNNLNFKYNDVFSLSENGLEANSKMGMGNWLKHITEVSFALKTFKENKFINYDILIKNPKYEKPYYGKIAFFNMNKGNDLSAVARYREISIDDTYFENATRGRTAIMYEYANHNYGGFVGDLKIPTWIILMSDEPF